MHLVHMLLHICMAWGYHGKAKVVCRCKNVLPAMYDYHAMLWKVPSNGMIWRNWWTRKSQVIKKIGEHFLMPLWGPKWSCNRCILMLFLIQWFGDEQCSKLWTILCVHIKNTIWTSLTDSFIYLAKLVNLSNL